MLMKNNISKVEDRLRGQIEQFVPFLPTKVAKKMEEIALD